MTAVRFSKVRVGAPTRWMWRAQVYMVSGVPVWPLPHSNGQKAKPTGTNCTTKGAQSFVVRILSVSMEASRL